MFFGFLLKCFDICRQSCWLHKHKSSVWFCVLAFTSLARLCLMNSHCDEANGTVLLSWVQRYNDNFFTSRDLAIKLLAKRTSLVGTMRMNRKEISISGKLSTHDFVFYSSDLVHLVKYQAKPTKTVVMLSTQHNGTVHQSDGKKKPESILYYNINKCEVDMLDSKCKQMSTKAACRRWPLAVFFNILDLASVNAWIIFKKVTGSTIARRDFIHQLAAELTEATTSATARSPSAAKLTTRKEGQLPNQTGMQSQSHYNCL